ncbi:MAG: STAS domain-containing protein [Panacagrimonas sp.]
MEGELSFATVRNWLPQADTLAARSRLDLAAVTRIDSAGAAFLLELSRRAAAQGRELEFANVSAQSRGLLEFLQIDSVLKLS